MITSRPIDRNVKFTRLLRFPQEASTSKILLLVAVLAILGALTACGDAHLPVLTSITVAPANSTIDIGQTQQFTAVGTFSDGNTRDLTNLVTWSSSSTTVAAISSSGLALSRSQGSSIISASFNTSDGLVTGGTTLNVVVTLKSLTITPVNPSIANSTSLQLTAAGVFSDGSTQDLTASVTWTSSAATIATVSSGGVVTGAGLGSATIAATQAGVSASTTVTVTAATLTAITITPPNSAIANATSKQLIATGNFSDGTTQNLTAFVTWTSSNPSVAAVSNAAGSQGLVTGSGVGRARITATYGGVSGSTLMLVTSATLTGITITPPDPSIAKGTSRQLIATGNFSDGTTQNLTALATWTSSNPSLAAVSNAVRSRGLVTGTGVGNATITATLGGVSGSTRVTTTPPTLTSIDIAPPNLSLAKGTSLQLTAIGSFSDGTAEDLTTSATWTSSAPQIAVVANAAGNQGLIIGILVGSATITAMQAGVSGSTIVTVTPAILTSIVVTPANASIALGTTAQLTAAGTFSDGTTQDLTTSASWISTSDAVATVGNTGSPGLATGTGVGSATITATQAGVSGSATVTVTAAILTSITITPPNPSIAKATTVQLIATGTFSDGTTQDFTASASWISTSDAIAPVGNTGSPGLVTGTGVGSATITATQAGMSGSATVTVTPATLISIAVTPAGPTITIGTTVQLTATGTFSDGTPQDLTHSVSWTSADTGFATIDSKGLVTGTGQGSPTITATATPPGVSGATTVTVVPPSAEFAYVTNDTDNTVRVFKIDSSTGALTEISGSPFSNPGSGAASVTADPSSKFLYTANQGDGTVTAYAITPSVGGLSLISPNVFSGNGAFGTAVDPSGKFAYVGNLGDNTISGYSIDPTTGILTAVPGSPFSSLPGTGPQGIAAHPGDNFIYVTGSGTNNVTRYTFDSTTGILSLPGTVFGPAPGTITKPVSITLDPLAKFAYTANNLPSPNYPNGSVTAYTINPSEPNLGALTVIGNFNAGTLFGGPAMVAVDPSGRFAYVAGGGVTAFTIDSTMGTLTPIPGSPFAAGLNTLSVAVDPSGKFVYAAAHGGSFGGRTIPGQVTVYAINPITGALSIVTNLLLPVGPSSVTVVTVP